MCFSTVLFYLSRIIRYIVVMRITKWPTAKMEPMGIGIYHLVEAVSHTQQGKGCRSIRRCGNI